jgi:mannose-6-phosphate isomerase-like protein (cupin superfamily)
MVRTRGGGGALLTGHFLVVEGSFTVSPDEAAFSLSPERSILAPINNDFS